MTPIPFSFASVTNFDSQSVDAFTQKEWKTLLNEAVACNMPAYPIAITVCESHGKTLHQAYDGCHFLRYKTKHIDPNTRLPVQRLQYLAIDCFEYVSKQKQKEESSKLPTGKNEMATKLSNPKIAKERADKADTSFDLRQLIQPYLYSLNFLGDNHKKTAIEGCNFYVLQHMEEERKKHSLTHPQATQFSKQLESIRKFQMIISMQFFSKWCHENVLTKRKLYCEKYQRWMQTSEDVRRKQQDLLRPPTDVLLSPSRSRSSPMPSSPTSLTLSRPADLRATRSGEPTATTVFPVNSMSYQSQSLEFVLTNPMREISRIDLACNEEYGKRIDSFTQKSMIELASRCLTADLTYYVAVAQDEDDNTYIFDGCSLVRNYFAVGNTINPLNGQGFTNVNFYSLSSLADDELVYVCSLTEIINSEYQDVLLCSFGASDLALTAERRASDQATLGRAYETGRGVDKDLAQALYWYNKAAAQNNYYAHCRLGQLSTDPTASLNHLLEGIRFGIQELAEVLKLYHTLRDIVKYRGQDVTQNTQCERLKQKYFEIQTHLGHVYLELGTKYLAGEGCERNEATVKFYLQNAFNILDNLDAHVKAFS